MKSCGFIATYMFRDLNTWRGWKELPFNIPLLIYQLTFIVIGTAYGKIKWPGRYYNAIDLYIYIAFGIAFVTIPEWWNIPMIISFVFVVIAMIRHIDWRKVWQAAQVSHVRLCLDKVPDEQVIILEVWRYINFGYPKAEIQNWTHISERDRKRFRYFDPTFSPSPEFIEAMIQYAEDQVGKGYDELQLISSGLHLIAWIVWPWSWGKELRIIKALNRKGGREFCSSGFTACLRWGEKIEEQHLNAGCIKRAIITIFFTGYDTAVVPPCLALLSKNWEVK